MPARTTGDDAPCPAAHGTRRFLGADPSLLLLALDEHGTPVEVPGSCDRVDRRHERWIALGPLGEVIAHAEVTDVDRYEPYEGFVQLEPIWSIPRARIVGSLSGIPTYPIALFAASDGPAPGAPSRRWDPTEAERRAAVLATETVAAAVAPTFETHDACMRRTHSEDECFQLETRQLFFRARVRDDADHDGAPDVRDVGVALAGSRDLLAVLVLDETHHRFALDGLYVEPNEHGFLIPVGAIDVTGDGFPEVIARVTDLTDWAFVILRRSAPGRWERIAEGSHGSTS